MNNKNIIKRISFIVMFAALTTVLYLFAKFPLPIFPGFLDINLSMIPVIICAFMLGPWDAAVVVLIRFVIKLPMTSTAYVGEIADLILGMIPAVTAGCIYKYYKGKHSASLAFVSVIALWTVVGILLNAYLNIPFYLHVMFEDNWDPLIGASKVAFELISFGAVKADSITPENFMFYYLLIGVLPFNLLLSSVVVLITAPIHKRLKHLYDMIGTKERVKGEALV